MSEQTIAEQIILRRKPFRQPEVRKESPFRVWTGRYLEYFGADDEDPRIVTIARVTRRTELQYLYVLNTMWARMCADKVDQPRDGSYLVEVDDGTIILIGLKTKKADARSFPGDAVLSFQNMDSIGVNAKNFGTLNCGEYIPWHFQSKRTDLRQAVELVKSDPAKYSKAYGLWTGKCGVCGRTLTNPVSINAGIGPVCLERVQ